MDNTPENPEAEHGPGFNLNVQMPEKVPVVMSGEGVGAIFEATREFIEEHAKSELGHIHDPETGAILPIIRHANGTIETFRLSNFDEANGAPRFRKGTAKFTTIESFIAHVNRFGDDDSAVFVNDDPTGPSLLSVLDYHEADFETAEEIEGIAAAGERLHGDYRFGWHRGAFAFPLSEEWKAWNASNGKVMKMGEFAAFIEKRVADLGLMEDDLSEETERFVTMNGGKAAVADFSSLVALSRGLKVNETSNVEEAVNLASGEGQIRFSVEHKTQVGGNSVKVPTMFFIAIPIFKRGYFYRIAAKLSYRKTAEGLVFWYDLHRHDKAFDHAIKEAVDRVDAETKAQVFYGSPEA